MSLNLFDVLESVPDVKLHPKFTLLRDNPLLAGERNILLDWAEGFEDRDNKIIKEFQTTFHSVLWELYLHKLFKDSGLTIDFSKDRPDFIISGPTKLYVEAVVSEIKQGGRPENTRGLDDVLSMLQPLKTKDQFEPLINEAITRYSNSIGIKHRKYLDNYSQCEWVDENAPYAIALASYAQVNYGKEFHYPMLALLFGSYYDCEAETYSTVDSIIKPGTDSSIPVGIFLNDAMKEISAVIFSCTLSLGKLTSLMNSDTDGDSGYNFVMNIRHDMDFPHFKMHIVNPNSPEEHSDGLFIFHNPFAINKLPKDAFGETNAVHITYEDGNLRFYGANLPIVSRFNIPKALLPGDVSVKFVKETFACFNPGYKESQFTVDEIDLIIDPPEITLIDIQSSFPVCVDLSSMDVDLINQKGISDGDSVTAALKGISDEWGNMTAWQLLAIDKF